MNNQPTNQPEKIEHIETSENCIAMFKAISETITKATDTEIKRDLIGIKTRKQLRKCLERIAASMAERACTSNN